MNERLAGLCRVLCRVLCCKVNGGSVCRAAFGRWAVGVGRVEQVEPAAAVSCLSVIVWLVAFRPDIKIHKRATKISKMNKKRKVVLPRDKWVQKMPTVGDEKMALQRPENDKECW